MQKIILLFFISLVTALQLKTCQQAPSAIQADLSADAPNPKQLYEKYCSGCHGQQMEAFADRRWTYGTEHKDLVKGIKYGYEDGGMPAFDTTFTDQEIDALATYILEGIAKVEKYRFTNKKLPKTYQSEELDYQLEKVVGNVEVPWGMAFLPNGDLLVTERGGGVYRANTKGDMQAIEGVPPVLAKNQGGMLDVALHPDFANNQYVYLSYSIIKKENGKTLSTTAINRGKLVGNRFTKSTKIFEALPYSTRRHHYGCRLVFDREGYLYFSVGDRGNRGKNPQSLGNHCGKIHRIYDDGRIPTDNPFVEQPKAKHSIYSYGHRNPQGVTLHPSTGQIWTHEHGPRGGDEINIIRKGDNYGWPIISYGINYNGTTFTDKTHQSGMEQPLHYWIPSIGPSGMTFITGDRYPAWKGDLLVGSLRFKYLNRCKIKDGKVIHEENLLKNVGRMRHVAMGPDGYIYVAVEGEEGRDGAVYRIVPTNS